MSDPPISPPSASQVSLGDNFARSLQGEAQRDPRDATIASLERKIEDINNKKLEERFLWVVLTIVLLDAYVFTHMENIAGPVVIGLIELVGIVILADRCRVDTVAPLIDRLAGFTRRATGTDESGNKT